MPAKSKKVRRAMAIAEHHPEKLFKRNRGLLKMNKSQLHDFAATSEKGLPYSAKSKRKKKKPKAGTLKGYRAGLSGQKIRSGGKGRGLGRGKGRGPIGRPSNDDRNEIRDERKRMTRKG